MDSFLADVRAGLSSSPKSLSSKYFYDATGDALFVKIMAMPEYYLTRAEMEIFQQQAPAIVGAFTQSKDAPFEVIELGAGDGSKTVHLLSELLRQNYQFEYLPIDISDNALEGLKQSLGRQLPKLSVTPKAGDYFQMLTELRATHHPKIVLFLGSNIGNLYDQEAAQFIGDLAKTLLAGDKLLLGVDLIKPVEVVLPAYDDAQGLTRDFNLNLLARINAELGGDFDLSQFDHEAQYDEKEGIARSFLISKKNQQVTISAARESYSFAQGERIKVEISRKYNREIIAEIIRDTPFRIVEVFTDRAQRFADYLLEVED